jgi:hypothetical protein
MRPLSSIAARQTQDLSQSTTARLIVTPARPGRFIARLESGEVIVADTRQPLVDGARELIARGFPAGLLLTLRHVGKGYDSFVPLPTAAWAGWTYKERDKGGLAIERWIPFAVPRSGEGTIPTGPAAVRAARIEFAPAVPAVHGTISGGQS